jgi:hypothetical protein
LQDKAPRVSALGYVVGNSDGDYTSETRHRSVPVGFFSVRFVSQPCARSTPDGERKSPKNVVAQNGV